MARTLKIGIIGASASRGWARISHVPAVQGLPSLELAAVAGTDQARAEAAARAFGVAKAVADPAALFHDPEIDIVTVAVRVPSHLDLVLGAIRAGKHVYCEWPLGRTEKEAVAMATAARAAGVKTAIGLQARLHPATILAARMVAQGDIGRVLSARILSTTIAWGPVAEAAMAFAEDPASAVNLVTVQAMHTLDLATAVLGDIDALDALASRQYPDVQVEGEAEPKSRRTFDHLLAQARLSSGAPLALEVIGGRPADDVPFRLEVTGDQGTLALEGGAPRGFQSGTLRLVVDGTKQHIALGELDGLPDEAVNVAATYAALRDDILHGSSTAPGFDHAVGLTRMIDDVLASSAEGRRVAARGGLK